MNRPAAFLDITGEVCPMTYVRTKLKLEQMSPGEVLEVRLKGEDPLRNVPGSAVEEGHQVLRLEQESEGIWTLHVKKGQEGA
jgi:TusA-related sulfurtransferase